MSKLSIQHWLRRTYVSAFRNPLSALSPFLYKESRLTFLPTRREVLHPHQVSLPPPQVSLPPPQVSLPPPQVSLAIPQVSLPYTQQLKLRFMLQKQCLL